jgi:hypothetical protein
MNTKTKTNITATGRHQIPLIDYETFDRNDGNMRKKSGNDQLARAQQTLQSLWGNCGYRY